MQLYAPDYYKDFLCIGENCKYNCCTDWEIDIDLNTYNYYKSLKGSFSDKLLKNISHTNPPYFILDKNKRCPFLNKNNLCDIIINLGEEHLCQICSDHPRFRNFFDTRTEIGLGLACIEAARIIISNTNKVTVLPMEQTDNSYISEDDEVFFSFRQNLFDIIQNRDIKIKERISLIRSKFNIDKKTYKETAELLSDLEFLDQMWHEKLTALLSLEPADEFIYSSFSVPIEQLLHYFIFRHLSDAQFDGEYRKRIAFACFSAETVCLLAYSQSKKANLNDLIEAARLFSSEIEYSDENIHKILTRL